MAQKINLKTGRPVSETTRKKAAINTISKQSGMKESAVKRAAEAGSRLNYSSPAYRNLMDRISEGDKTTARKYTRTLQGKRK